MVTVHKANFSREACLKGAPEVVLGFCDRIMVANDIVQLNDNEKDWFKRILNGMTSTGERCLGLAYRTETANEIPDDGIVFVGIAGMLDPLRPEVSASLQKCRGAGIRVFFADW